MLEQLTHAPDMGCSFLQAAIREQSDGHKDQGNAALKAGDFQRAVEHYSASIQADPTNFAALNNRALAFLKLGKFQPCVKDADAVLVAEPDNVKVCTGRGEEGGE